MIIKETPWEKRNLGVESSIEYYVDSSEYEGLETIWNSEYDYQVLHIASGNMNALISAQDNGFHLIELNVRLQKILEEVELPPLLQRYRKVINYRYAVDKDLEQILRIVREGKMFLTDKIALDPFFGVKQSGERYFQWTRDVLERGAITVVCTYKDSPIGFEIYEENNEKNECVNFIGGVFPEFMNKGLGFAPLYVELLDQKNRGNNKVITGVSSNNLPVLKVHELLGFKVENLSYLLVKHIKGDR